MKQISIEDYQENSNEFLVKFIYNDNREKFKFITYWAKGMKKQLGFDRFIEFSCSVEDLAQDLAYEYNCDVVVKNFNCVDHPCDISFDVKTGHWSGFR